MSVMHLNDLSSTLALGSDVLSAACAQTAANSDITACRTIKVDRMGRESLVMVLSLGKRCIELMSQVCRRPD